MDVIKVGDFKKINENIEIFLKNSIVGADSFKADGFIPVDFFEVATKLFSMDNVGVSTASQYAESRHSTIGRGMSSKDFIKEIQKKLDRGAEIFLYEFYGARQKIYAPFDTGILVDENGLTSTYWWRYIASGIKKQ